MSCRSRNKRRQVTVLRRPSEVGSGEPAPLPTLVRYMKHDRAHHSIFPEASHCRGGRGERERENIQHIVFGGGADVSHLTTEIASRAGPGAAGALV